MGIYLRGRFYWYKRMIDGTCYYRSLKIKKGQESMLSFSRGIDTYHSDGASVHP